MEDDAYLLLTMIRQCRQSDAKSIIMHLPEKGQFLAAKIVDGAPADIGYFATNAEAESHVTD